MINIGLTFTVKNNINVPTPLVLFEHVCVILGKNITGLERRVINTEFSKSLRPHIHVYLKCESIDFNRVRQEYLYNSCVYFKDIQNVPGYLYYITKQQNPHLPCLDETIDNCIPDDSIIRRFVADNDSDGNLPF